MASDLTELPLAQRTMMALSSTAKQAIDSQI